MRVCVCVCVCVRVRACVCVSVRYSLAPVKRGVIKREKERGKKRETWLKKRGTSWRRERSCLKEPTFSGWPQRAKKRGKQADFFFPLPSGKIPLRLGLLNIKKVSEM